MASRRLASVTAPHIGAVDPHRAGGDVVQARDQRQRGGFAGRRTAPPAPRSCPGSAVEARGPPAPPARPDRRNARRRTRPGRARPAAPRRPAHRRCAAARRSRANTRTSPASPSCSAAFSDPKRAQRPGGDQQRGDEAGEIADRVARRSPRASRRSRSPPRPPRRPAPPAIGSTRARLRVMRSSARYSSVKASSARCVSVASSR